MLACGIINSLVSIINNPDVIDNTTQQQRDITNNCLLTILEYCNFKDDNIKVEVIKNKSAIILLKLVKKDITDLINELAFKILSSLCENDFCREIVIKDGGLLVGVEMYKKNKVSHVKK